MTLLGPGVSDWLCFLFAQETPPRRDEVITSPTSPARSPSQTRNATSCVLSASSLLHLEKKHTYYRELELLQIRSACISLSRSRLVFRRRRQLLDTPTLDMAISLGGLSRIQRAALGICCSTRPAQISSTDRRGASDGRLVGRGLARRGLVTRYCRLLGRRGVVSTCSVRRCRNQFL